LNDTALTRDRQRGQRLTVTYTSRPTPSYSTLVHTWQVQVHSKTLSLSICTSHLLSSQRSMYKSTNMTDGFISAARVVLCCMPSLGGVNRVQFRGCRGHHCMLMQSCEGSVFEPGQEKQQRMKPHRGDHTPG